MVKFDRYKQNLKFEHPYVYSYNTKVAEVRGHFLVRLGRWSITTTKHTNYAAKQLNKILI